MKSPVSSQPSHEDPHSKFARESEEEGVST